MNLVGREPSGIRKGTLRWRIRVRGVVYDGPDLPQTFSNGTIWSYHDELAGVRFACPVCGRMTAVLRKYRRKNPTQYWLVCLYWRSNHRRGIAIGGEQLQSLLTNVLGARDAELVLTTKKGRVGKQ